MFFSKLAHLSNPDLLKPVCTVNSSEWVNKILYRDQTYTQPPHRWGRAGRGRQDQQGAGREA